MTEILISAAYVFLVVNLLASSGTEAVASFFRWRSRMLADGVRLMLNDKVTGLATEVYSNPLVHPRSVEEGEEAFGKNLPSYIDPRNFAIALFAALKLEQSSITGLRGRSAAEIARWIADHVPQLRADERLRKLLADSIQRNDANLDLVRAATARWFSLTSDRISGAYKRRTQLSSFLIALVLAVVFNLSPLPPSLAALLQEPAAAALATGNGAAPAAALPPGQAPSVPAEAGAQPGGRNAAWTAVARVFGWFAIAMSTLLGAPFWFGVLSKVTPMRGAGAPPDEKEATPPVAQITATAQPGTVVASTEPGAGQASPETPPAQPQPPGGGSPPAA